MKNQSGGCQDKTGQDQHGKRCAHDTSRFIHVAPSSLYAKQRRAAQPEKVGEGRDERDDRKTQTQPGQGIGPFFREHADIDPIHDIIQQV